MRVAICDDEKVWVDFIKNVVDEYMISNEYDMEVLCFNSGESLLNVKEKFDLIFLDEIMQGLNGLETAKRLRKFDQNVKIVFVTNYIEVMQKAFYVNAFRFIEKNLLEESIVKCLNDYFREIKNDKQIEVDFTGSIIKINQKDIMYITAIRNGSFICCSNEQFVSKLPLKDYENMLDKDLFYRCHRNAIVNISYIDWIDKKITLYKGYTVNCSRRNKAELVKLHVKYLVENAR